VNQLEISAPDAQLLSRAPSPALVVGAIASVQFGAAIATTPFARVGPAGAVALRLSFATVVLLALWRPRLAGRRRRELLLACLFGLVLAGMNLSFYGAERADELDRDRSAIPTTSRPSSV
jgi:inner membrane transporter RhtA